MFIFFVLKRQYSLFKLPIKDEGKLDGKAIRHFRAVLFGLALIVFIGNIVPFGIDLLTILNDDFIGRPGTVRVVSFIYTLSASLTSLISSYLIWRLYRLAADEKDITDLTVRRQREEMNKK